MLLAQHCLSKVAKNCQKKPKVNFRVNYIMGSDNSGSENTGTVSSAADLWPAASCNKLQMSSVETNVCNIHVGICVSNYQKDLDMMHL